MCDEIDLMPRHWREQERLRLEAFQAGLTAAEFERRRVETLISLVQPPPPQPDATE